VTQRKLSFSFLAGKSLFNFLSTCLVNTFIHSFLFGLNIHKWNKSNHLS
jgi:hypothetical protein